MSGTCVRFILNCKCIDFFAVQHILILTYRMYVYLRFLGTSTSQVIGTHNQWWVMMIMMAKWYSGTWGPKASWHLSYRWGKTPKNLTQETCPDWGSNPGPLCDRRTCHLAHSSGLTYRNFTIHFVSKYYERWEINHVNGIG